MNPLEEEKIELETMGGMDWDNNGLFFTYEFEDETSQFDPKGKWCYGGEYYSRVFRCRVPICFRDCDLMVDWFVTMMTEDHNDTKGFWVPDHEPTGSMGKPPE